MERLPAFFAQYDDDARAYIDSVAECYGMLARKGASFVRGVAQSEIVTEETNAIVFIYRHALSLIDSASAVAAVPSVEGLRMILRGLFEAKVSLEYMLSEDVENRAVAYQVDYILRKIGSYEKLNPNTKAGKKLRKDIKNDRLIPDDFLSEEIDVSGAIENLENQLARDPYKRAAERFDASKSKRWYSLDGGPSGFWELCERTRNKGMHAMVHGDWSALSHSEALYRDVVAASKSRDQIHPLRTLSGYHSTASIGLSLAVDFFTRSFERRFPKLYLRFGTFYRNQYWPFFKANIEGRGDHL